MKPIRTEIQALLRLAAPLATSQILLMTLGLVDMVMVGHLDSTSLASLAVANTFYFSLTIGPVGMLMVLDTLVSQAWGAGEYDRCGRWLLRGLAAAVCLAIPLAILMGWGTAPLLELLRQPPDVVPIATTYLRALVPGVAFRLMYVAARQYLHAQGRVGLPLGVIAVVNIVHVFLNWMLVYGKLGMPALGVLGVGWSTSFCDALALALLLGFILMGREWRERQSPWRRPEARLRAEPILHWTAAERLLRIGLPLGVQYSLEGWGFVCATFMAGWLGTTVVAGHQVGLSLASFAYMLPLGLSGAVAVRVGQAIGRGDPVAMKRSVNVATIVALVLVVCSASIFIAIPGPLARIYTDSPEILVVTVSVLPVAAAFQLFDAMQAIGFGVLRGSGDTRLPAIANVVGFWLLGLPIGYLLAFNQGMGAPGIWWGLAIGLCVVSISVHARIRWNLRRPIRRVEG